MINHEWPPFVNAEETSKLLFVIHRTIWSIYLYCCF